MSLDIPYIPFGTKGWGGQVGQRVVLRDTMGHPLMSHGVPGLRGGMDRWTVVSSLFTGQQYVPNSPQTVGGHVC